jgi:HPt (histidine-containing phosphotransfer) domain-containing protein
MMEVDQQILSSLFATLKSGSQWESIIGLFDSGWAARLLAVENSVKVEDFTAAKSAAHALKGSCFMFGATACAKMCERLENLITSGDVEGVLELVNEIRRELMTFRGYLDQELRSRNLLI